MALKTQLANVMSSTHDYGTKASRLKRDMLDAGNGIIPLGWERSIDFVYIDREYRRSVADLERLRKKQVDTANHAVKVYARLAAILVDIIGSYINFSM